MESILTANTKGMFYRSIAKSYAQKNMGASPEQRFAAADILNAHLLMVEIMMSNITNMYIHRVISGLKKNGIMRQRLKQKANLLESISTDLQRRCNYHDKLQVETFCKTIFPSLVPVYIECGGTLSIKLQLLFYKTYEDMLNCIHETVRKAIEKNNVPYGDIFSNAEMVAILAQVGIDFYEVMRLKIKDLLTGIGNYSCVKSRHNEVMLSLSKDILYILGGGININLPEKESEDVHTLSASFQKELTKESLLKMIEGAIVSLKTDFIEFVIATLRVEMEDGKLPLTDIRTLLARLGTSENVRKLLREIRNIPMPEENGFDIMDFSHSLPDSLPGSPLSTFRRLCLEDHILTPPKRNEKIVLRRKIIQEAKENKGILSLVTLKKLYSVSGSKKVMLSFLKESGEELKLAIKELRNIKVYNLK